MFPRLISREVIGLTSDDQVRTGCVCKPVARGSVHWISPEADLFYLNLNEVAPGVQGIFVRTKDVVPPGATTKYIDWLSRHDYLPLAPVDNDDFFKLHEILMLPSNFVYRDGSHTRVTLVNVRIMAAPLYAKVNLRVREERAKQSRP